MLYHVFTHSRWLHACTHALYTHTNHHRPPSPTPPTPKKRDRTQQLDCLRSIKLTERGMLEAAEGSYISIEPYTGRAMQAHMAMQVRVRGLFVFVCM